jgi:hypothetical protein
MKGPAAEEGGRSLYERSIKIALISQALLICIMAASSEALSISILSPSPEEQVLESGRDFYVIGRIDREGLAPVSCPSI